MVVIELKCMFVVMLVGLLYVRIDKFPGGSSGGAS
jgi:hypothetical protein